MVARYRAAAVRAPAILVAAWTLAGLAQASPAAAPAADPGALALVDRITWGVDSADLAAAARLGPERWLDGQLHPPPGDRLPPAVQARIDAMPALATPLTLMVAADEAERKAANALTDPDQKKAARQVYEMQRNDAARQAAARSVLRDIYSPDQLREQMTWFWFNHFNVHQSKADIRLMVGDYEDRAIRPHALGRFRDLLEATLRHPAMLRYLDNASNAAGHINENYAREIMELHTLGVGGGYSQADVEALAHILTGVGIDSNPDAPNLPPPLRGQLVRDGLFEFNPRRHDYGDKVLLGRHIRGRGFAEVEEALDILCEQPATARHISRELAAYFLPDDPPPPAVVEAMSRAFLASRGDIARVLAVLFHSDAFRASLGKGFKDPAHYVLSSVRLAWDGKVIANPMPVVGWLGRLGEGLYGHETPDGYAMAARSWDGPGQMAARFELARQIGGGGAGLFRIDAPGAVEPPGTPDVAGSVRALGLDAGLSDATRAALAQASSPRDWNTLFLASPEFMRR